MKYLYICLTLLLSTVINSHAQARDETRTIDVTATAEVLLPADLIQFNITLNAEADTPQEAYANHQKLEGVLVALFEKYDIKEEDIQFEPIAINDYLDRSDEGDKTTYQTRQMVQVSFSNFDIYEEIQIALIKNGFDNFNGYFMTTKKEDGVDKALRKAIEKAKVTADLMAEAAGVVLGPISHMSYSERIARPYAGDRVSMSMAKTEGLMQYNQTVTVSATVAIEFVIGQ